MRGFLRALVFSFPLISGLPAVVFAQSQNDPVQDLVGEWYVKNSHVSLTIKRNHSVQHSKWGSGDIKWDNADYFDIRYRDRDIKCNYQVRLYSPTEIDFIRAENLNPAECDLGEMRRVPSEEDARKRS
jgi:hypothetical protein